MEVRLPARCAPCAALPGLPRSNLTRLDRYHVRRGVAVPQAILAHIHGDHRGQKHDTKERSDGNEAPEPRDEDFVGLGPR